MRGLLLEIFEKYEVFPSFCKTDFVPEISEIDSVFCIYLEILIFESEFIFFLLVLVEMVRNSSGTDFCSRFFSSSEIINMFEFYICHLRILHIIFILPYKKNV